MCQANTCTESQLAKDNIAFSDGKIRWSENIIASSKQRFSLTSVARHLVLEGVAGVGQVGLQAPSWSPSLPARRRGGGAGGVRHCPSPRC